MSRQLSRREFLKTSGAIAASASLGLAGAAHNSNRVSANDTLQVGVIGTGDRGAWEVYIFKHTPGTKVV
ncbi:MAG TPA: twin-arginine translocation signal domain-containing protein, partial [bacterium]